MQSLNLGNCKDLTDAGLGSLAEGCLILRSLDLTRQSSFFCYFFLNKKNPGVGKCEDGSLLASKDIKVARHYSQNNSNNLFAQPTMSTFTLNLGAFVRLNPTSILTGAISRGKIQEKAEDAEGGLCPISPESLAGKIVCLYFSAHWCPPCQEFTPLLAAKYKELVDAGHPIEIIFVSSDSSEAEAREYFSEMPWKMLDYGSRSEKNELGRAYSVSGIPSLVMLDESLRLITSNGRSAIMNCEFDKLKTYETDLIAAKAVIAEKVEASS